jgi:hypothetical protein
MVAETFVIVPLLQMASETTKEHGAASFSLIASFGGKADIVITPEKVRF